MRFAFKKCRDVFHSGIITALTANADAIKSLSAVDAISCDIYPWNEVVTLSFRATTDKLDVRYSPPDWKYYQLIDDKSLDAVRNYARDVYPLSGGTAGQEALHLILLAAAHALLDNRVATLLQDFGLDATVRGDRIPWGGFEYVVLDEDEAFRANYCEIVLANRVTERLLGRRV